MADNSKHLAVLLDERGGATEYKRLSARLPEFRKQYPATEYRVVIEADSVLDHSPALAGLYAKAIEKGLRPLDLGLPPIDGSAIVFTAKLIDQNGDCVETGSARREVTLFKDWEKGETAARQRLIAALGFGGDIIDDDENGDIKDQGLKVGNSDQRPTPLKAVNETKSHQTDDASISSADSESEMTSHEGNFHEEEPSTPDAQPDEQASVADIPSDGPEANNRADEAQPEASTSDNAEEDRSILAGEIPIFADNGERIADYIVRQIRSRASIKGATDSVPYSVATPSDAKEVLKGLMK